MEELNSIISAQISRIGQVDSTKDWDNSGLQINYILKVESGHIENIIY